MDVLAVDSTVKHTPEHTLPNLAPSAFNSGSEIKGTLALQKCREITFFFFSKDSTSQHVPHVDMRQGRLMS